METHSKWKELKAEYNRNYQWTWTTVKNFTPFEQDDKNIVDTKNAFTSTVNRKNFFHIVWHLWFVSDTSRTFQCSFKNACAKREIHFFKDKNKNLQRKYAIFFENFKESVFLSKIIVVANKQLTNINSEKINNNLASNIFAAGLLSCLFLSFVFCHVYLPFITEKRANMHIFCAPHGNHFWI